MKIFLIGALAFASAACESKRTSIEADPKDISASDDQGKNVKSERSNVEIGFPLLYGSPRSILDAADSRCVSLRDLLAEDGRFRNQKIIRVVELDDGTIEARTAFENDSKRGSVVSGRVQEDGNVEIVEFAAWTE